MPIGYQSTTTIAAQSQCHSTLDDGKQSYAAAEKFGLLPRTQKEMLWKSLWLFVRYVRFAFVV